MLLATLKQLHANIFTYIPINDQVIYRVYELANKRKHPEITKGHPIFEWIPGISIMYQSDIEHISDRKPDND